ncbi:MAG: hypothetical protein U1F43_12060 [Myxococcota bacterium]
MPADMMERARARLGKFAKRFYRDHDHDFGSNEWAVSGKKKRAARTAWRCSRPTAT